MRTTTILLAAILAATPALALQTSPETVPEVTGKDGPEDEAQTVPAITSKIAVNEARNPWRGAGTMSTAKGRRAAPALKIDYDQDGVMDTARLVESRIHAAVLLTSGGTGRTRPIWLINSKGLGPDAYLRKAKKGHITIVFPESTIIDLYEDKGRPMAWYQNG